MTEHLEQKQKRIVCTWIGIANDYAADQMNEGIIADECRSVPQADNYTAFIAMWVALNALCNARYYNEANKLMADIRTDRKKTKSWVEGSGERANGDWTSIGDTSKCDVDIARQSVFGMEKLKLRIKEKYTESIIYDEFTREFSAEYQSWIQDPPFQYHIHKFRDSLIKENAPDIPYVINMARKREYHITSNVDELKQMKERSIIVIYDDRNKLHHLMDVLYQVRCNIFHGEKSPGEPNDDRIVIAAYPVLRELMARTCDRLGISDDGL